MPEARAKVIASNQSWLLRAVAVLTTKPTTKQVYITCACALAILLVNLPGAHAQGKSAESNGHGSGTPGLQTEGGVQGGSGSAATSTSLDSNTDQNISVGTDPIGAYGQLGASHTTDIGNSMFLQMYGGVDLDQQTSAAPAGALNGRVGLGWKY